MNWIKVISYNLWKLYVGIVFLLTLFLFYPILWIILQFKSLKPLSFKINICWSYLVRFFCFYPVKLSGNRPQKDTSYIIIGNHTSYLDIFLLYSILPHHRFLFMGKSELLNYPLIKIFFKKLNIPVDRSSRIKSARAFIQAREEIKRGWNIVIFPEGGIFNDAPQLHPFKNGAFQLAKAANCAILPIVFMNHHKLLSDPESRQSPAMPGISKIHFLPELSEKEIQKLTIEEINQHLFQQINTQLTKQ